MAIYRVVYHGHIASDAEEFNYGLHVQAASGQAVNILTTAQEAGTIFWSGPPSPVGAIAQFVPITTGLDTVEVNELDDAFKQVEQAVGALLIPGTNVNDSLPPQCSVAVSTRTATPTKRGRGRWFTPPYATSVMIGILLDPDVRDATAAAAKAMLDHFNGDSFNPVLASPFNPSHAITAIDVGNVVDNQRRRRNQIPETRLRLTLA